VRVMAKSKYWISDIDDEGYIWIEFDGEGGTRYQVPLNEDGSILSNADFKQWIKNTAEGFEVVLSEKQLLQAKMKELRDREVVYNYERDDPITRKKGKRIKNFRNIN